MNTPPLLLGATLLFWGWQCGLLWLGVLLALVLEGSRGLRLRWNLTQSDLDRVWNLCALLCLGSVIIALSSGDSAVSGILDQNPARRVAALAKSGRSMLQILHWLPITLFPIVAAQAYGTSSQLPWSTFSWWLRRQRRQPAGPFAITGGLNVSWAYSAAVFVAASAANQSREWFFAAASGLLAWALWSIRPRTFPTPAWAAALLVVLTLGYGAQHGLVRLRVILQRLDAALVSRFSGSRFAPDQSHTRLGSVGNLKLSGRIVMRLTTPSNTPPPTLLREASFNLFKAPVWGSSRKGFNGVPSERDGTSWILRPNEPATRSFTLATFLPGGEGTLPAPLHCTRLERLPVALETNRFGTLHSASGPGYVVFDARYHDGPSAASPPDDEDLAMPPEEREAIAQVAAELNLTGQPPARAVALIETFFAERFRYSTWLTEEHRARTNRSALAAFLLQHRTGHCEYFATATTLLLRAARIHARYAVGYAVHERQGETYVIRQRHGHAWALAWIDNAWREVDNTPAAWHQCDDQHASRWQALGDLWSRIRFGFAQWRWGEGSVSKYLPWLLIPLVLLLAAQLFFKRQWHRSLVRSSSARSPDSWPGLDSDFYRIEQQLSEAGLTRARGETLSAWWHRVKVAQPMAAPELETAFALHYRLRFDPLGLTPEERQSLRDAVQRWTARKPAA